MGNIYWVARDISGELFLYDEKPEFFSDYKVWLADGICAKLDNNLFPDLTWEDEPIEVELRQAITDLDAKAQEYANSITDNEEIKKLIINAYKAGYNL